MAIQLSVTVRNARLDQTVTDSPRQRQVKRNRKTAAIWLH